MSRKQIKRRAGSVVFSAIAGVFVLAVVCGVGFGVASADSADELARAGAFGFDAATHNATLSSAEGSSSASADTEDATSLYERSPLTAPSSRDIGAGMQLVDEKERAEQERIAAENAAAIKRMEAEKAKQGVESTTEPIETAVEYSLPAVDWSVGRDAFVGEWTARIDAYLAGSPLAGYGNVFAEAAWDNGVDPRWSPAISNTESGKGSNCFKSYNAWGWGSSGWSDWETAIRAHVAGLASAYGYSITPEAARIYCPPNSTNWYNKTIAQMATI